MSNSQSKSDLPNASPMEQLLQVMSMLRNQEFGCPWDLQQSIKSLVPFTLEEVYEVVEAIELNDTVELEEELGDLLFQVVFYAQIAKEDGLFTFDGVAQSITEKLIRRHPHVFPNNDVGQFGQKIEIDTESVAKNWEIIKAEERELKRAKRLAKAAVLGNQPNDTNEEKPVSSLDSIALAIPALPRAVKVQSKAANFGFDWDDVTPVLAKLKEEIAELEEAINSQNQESIQDELGDVLFATVNVSRHVNVEPETALRYSTGKFTERFKWIEANLAAKNTKMNECSAETLEELWNEAKLNCP